MTGISKSQVSRLCEEMEKVKAFLSRPIEGDWPYLWGRKLRHRSRKRSVLTEVKDGCLRKGWDHGIFEKQPYAK